MSTKRERDNNAVNLHEKAKTAWLDFIEEFKNNRLLWDPKDKHYSNRYLRAQAQEQLLEKFKKIDVCATDDSMKKKLINMRAAYNRERKKVLESIQKGGAVYRPTLWYFDQFSFLDTSDKDVIPNFNTIKYFRKFVPGPKKPSEEEINSSVTPPSVRTNERMKGFTEEEEEDTETQPPHPKRRIFHLLQQQEKFIDTARKMLVREEEEWEVHGKAIGLQLDKLDKIQRTIANKLIADTIYYGSLGKLTTDAYIHIEDIKQLSPEYGKVETLEEHDDNSRESKKQELLFVQGSPIYNNDEDE